MSKGGNGGGVVLIFIFALVALIYFAIKFIAVGQWFFLIGSIFIILFSQIKLSLLKKQIQQINSVDIKEFEPTQEEQKSLNELRTDIQKQCEIQETSISEWESRLMNAKMKIDKAYQTAEREGLSFNQDGRISARSNLGKELLAVIDESNNAIALSKRNIQKAESNIREQQYRYRSALANTKGSILRSKLEETKEQNRKTSYNYLTFKFSGYMVLMSYILAGTVYICFFDFHKFIYYPILMFNGYVFGEGSYPPDNETHIMMACCGGAIVLAVLIICIYSDKYAERALKQRDNILALQKRSEA